MAKRPQDPAKELYWRETLGRFSSSGLSVRAFCQREQVAENLFYAWRRTIGQRDQPQPPPPTFVPAVVTEQATRESSIAIELAGGCVLRCASIEQLADLIVALQARHQR